MMRARVVRPRATRAFMTRRRAMLLSAFVVAAAFPIGGYLTGGKDSATAAVIAEVLRDPLAVLSGRSPGLREAGAMFQTKPGRSGERVASADRAPVGPAGPVERVLPVVRERPSEFVASPAGVPDVGPLALNDPTGPLGFPSDTTSGGGPGVFQPQLLPDTGSSGGTSGGVTSTSSGGGGIDPPPNPGPVPEPATWMTMILGFGLVGSAIRRQSAVRRAAARG